MTSVSDFDFHLPPSLIAQEAHARGTSRLLVVRRATEDWIEAGIRDLPALLDAGDLVVVNDSRVIPARLIGRRDPSGGAAECLLLEPLGGDDWEALVHPGQKLRAGTRLVFEDPVRAPGLRLHALVLERRFFGRRVVRLGVEGPSSIEAAIDALGHVPLPPYIRRPDRPDDRERYQTVYAAARGSIAAPTAGLHFDAALVEALAAAGIGWARITLHVGYGTFKPVRAEQVEAHTMDAERYAISAETADAITSTRASGHRVVAVGTTTVRALESAADQGSVRAGEGRTALFIYPGHPVHPGQPGQPENPGHRGNPEDARRAGHQFQVVDALLTNFHLPRSSLLMLVCAFGGTALVRAAYDYAIAHEFRFYSYGDAMLIL